MTDHSVSAGKFTLEINAFLSNCAAIYEEKEKKK